MWFNNSNVNLIPDILNQIASEEASNFNIFLSRYQEAKVIITGKSFMHSSNKLIVTL